MAGVSWAVTGAIISRALTLIASVLAARFLGTEDFGAFGIVQSTLGLFGVFAGAGLGLATTKYVAQYRRSDAAKTGQYISASLILAFSTGALIAILFALSAGLLAERLLDRPTLQSVLQISAGLVLFGAISGVLTGALSGLEDFRSIATLNAVRGLVLMVAVGFGAWRIGLLGAVAGTVVAELAAVLAGYIVLHSAARTHRFAFVLRKMERTRFGEIGGFALPALLSSLATQPALWLSSVLLVNQPMGYAAMGIFTAADRWRQIILFFPTSISSAVLPMLANLHASQDQSKYRKLLRVNLGLNLGSLAVPGVAVLLAPRLLMSLFGTEYVQGDTTLLVLTLSALGVALNNVLGQVLVSVGRIWLRFAFDVALATLLLVSAIILIPVQRDLGLAWANVTAYTLVSAGLIIAVLRILRTGATPTTPEAPLVPHEHS